MFKSKVFVAVLFSAIVHAAAIGQTHPSPAVRDDTGRPVVQASMPAVLAACRPGEVRVCEVDDFCCSNPTSPQGSSSLLPPFPPSGSHTISENRDLFAHPDHLNLSCQEDCYASPWGTCKSFSPCIFLVIETSGNIGFVTHRTPTAIHTLDSTVGRLDLIA